MLENRLNRIRSKFELLGIDTVWIIHPQNRCYISGFKAADGQLDESELPGRNSVHLPVERRELER